jgi:hypothetical protein
LYPTTSAPPTISAPIPATVDASGCYTVASPFGPRRVCSA